MITILTGISNTEPEKDGAVYTAVYFKRVRWKPYKLAETKLELGKDGRWQELNYRGFWQDCEEPSMHIINYRKKEGAIHD